MKKQDMFVWGKFDLTHEDSEHLEDLFVESMFHNLHGAHVIRFLEEDHDGETDYLMEATFTNSHGNIIQTNEILETVFIMKAWWSICCKLTDRLLRLHMVKNEAGSLTTPHLTPQEKYELKPRITFDTDEECHIETVTLVFALPKHHWDVLSKGDDYSEEICAHCDEVIKFKADPNAKIVICPKCHKPNAICSYCFADREQCKKCEYDKMCKHIVMGE